MTGDSDLDYARRLADFIIDHIEHSYDAEECGRVLEVRADPIPHAVDPRYSRLLAASRALVAARVGNTSSFPAPSFFVFLEAVEAFDRCDHPRANRVFHVNGQERCGKCGHLLSDGAQTTV